MLCQPLVSSPKSFGPDALFLAKTFTADLLTGKAARLTIQHRGAEKRAAQVTVDAGFGSEHLLTVWSSTENLDDMQIQPRERRLTWRDLTPGKRAEFPMPMDAEETRVE